MGRAVLKDSIESLRLFYRNRSDSVDVYGLVPVSLVVDDERSIRKYLGSILRAEDFHILEAEGGAQALRMLHDLGGGVDLIVSDIQMPDGDGLSLARAVKNSFPSVPVILMSGNPQPDGETAFIRKPILPDTLLGMVRKLFPRRAGSA